MTRIGIISSNIIRTGKSFETFEKVISKLRDIREVHHGDNKGIDSDIHDLFTEKAVKTIIYPSIDASNRANNLTEFEKKPKNNTTRYKRIIRKTDYIFTFPSNNRKNSKTSIWSVIKYAINLHKPVYIIYPNGDLETYNKR